ncbi:DedA family protein [Pseudonocardia acaciae]|uniref:DedA family protein n=1 Tax=Pseudonocardia acaciae TaxID=551276 RepID=UPI00068887AD|nr:VTT domain-containing protein [Pseudonocardia acaciae]
MPEATDLTWLGPLPVPVLLMVLVLLLVAETALVIGVFLPGATAALALGALARLGSVPVSPVVFAAAAAAALGGQLAYLAGRRSAARSGSIAGRLERALRPRHRELLTTMLRERGAGAVVLGQWIIGVRTLMPRLAGHAGLSYRRFSAHQLPTASAWAATLVLSGYGVGAAYERYGPAVAAAASVVLVLVEAARRRRTRSRSPRADAAGGARSDTDPEGAVRIRAGGGFATAG